MDQISDLPGSVVSRQKLAGPRSGDQLRQSVRYQVMLVAPLFSDDRLDKHAKPCTVAATLSFH
jgi:hypothetical protein